jgi:hypothetical protein
MIIAFGWGAKGRIRQKSENEQRREERFCCVHSSRLISCLVNLSLEEGDKRMTEEGSWFVIFNQPELVRAAHASTINHI